MAIVTCEHHGGIGLCPQCRRDEDAADERARTTKTGTLRGNANLLRRAADVLQAAGEYHLAQQIRQIIPN